MAQVQLKAGGAKPCRLHGLSECGAIPGLPCMHLLLLQEHLSYRQGPTKHFFESAEGAAGRGHSLGRQAEPHPTSALVSAQA
jgi:hypothetical protein